MGFFHRGRVAGTGGGGSSLLFFFLLLVILFDSCYDDVVR